MRAITQAEPGGPDTMRWSEVPDPVAGPGEVLVDVAATAVNRADVLQRQGRYPSPPGTPQYMGLECSGTISALGPDVDGGWQVGDEVCALLAGGGYAEKVAVPVETVLPVPTGVDLVTAGALPEAAATVWSNLVMTAGLRAGQTVLLHGGSSGIGTMAIQVARALGAQVGVTAGTSAKLDACRALGAQIAIGYRDDDFVEALRRHTDGHGADVILDLVGGPYLSRNVDALARNGRLVVIGMQGGTKAELNLATLLAKRAGVIGTTLRGRPLAEKAAIVGEVRDKLWPMLVDGRVRPVVHAVLPITEAAAAHRLMESSEHIGKIGLRVA